MHTPIDILKEYWKYSHFKPSQEEVIKNVLAKKNTLALLPTGAGKSVCYQVPALILDGVCVVISPLIALMQDQVYSLQKKGIKAIALTSELSNEDLITAFDNLKFGGYKFLYLSPEKLQSDLIQEKLSELHISLIAIDEAHCISEWGHDFRPSYLRINKIIEIHPSATVIALTATATKKVLDDIKNQLKISDFTVFNSTFYRSNISYTIINKEATYTALLQLISQESASIIIYVGTRKATKEISKFLAENKYPSNYYHGGLTFDEKQEVLNNWLANKVKIIVATNAFGMGIDKPDVRLVIHLNIPNSIENYIQEAGRAGRDGKPAKSVIITNNAIIKNTKDSFLSNTADVSYVKEVYSKLNQFYNISYGELPPNAFPFTLQEFCYKYNLNILKTYNALQILEREEILLIDASYSKKSTLKFTVSSTEIFNTIENTTLNEASILKLILRTYGGVLEHFTIINEYFLAKKINSSKQEITKTLQQLAAKNILNYQQQTGASQLKFLVIRENNYTIHSISKNIKTQNNHKLNKLRNILAYINNNSMCRVQFLFQYFNENIPPKCGQCDICLGKNNTSNNIDIATKIVEALKNQNLSATQLLQCIQVNEASLIKTLKNLIEENKITINSQNQFKLNE